MPFNGVQTYLITSATCGNCPNCGCLPSGGGCPPLPLSARFNHPPPMPLQPPLPSYIPSQLSCIKACAPCLNPTSYCPSFCTTPSFDGKFSK